MKSIAVEPSSPTKDTKGKSLEIPVAEQPPSDTSLTVLIAEEAELYLWDFETEEFSRQALVTAKIVHRTSAGFEYWVMASTDKGELLAHKITPDMNQKWSTKFLTLTWNHLVDNKSQSSWLFRFSDREAYDQFASTFTQSMWEGLHQVSWSKIKVRESSSQYPPVAQIYLPLRVMNKPT